MATITTYLATQQSRSLPVVYGTAKVSPVVVYKGEVGSGDAGWRYDAEAGAWKSVAGKSASVVFALCEAPVLEIAKAYRDGVTIAAADFYRLQDTYFGNNFYAKTAISEYTLGGTILLTGSNPADLQAMTLKGTAFYGASFLFLNDDGSVPDIKFEVRGLCLSGAAVNAHPADVVVDLLTNARYGVGLNAADVVTDVGPDGTANSSFRNYCTAWGIGVSRTIDAGEDAADLLESLLFCCNSVLVQSDGKLKVVPRADVAKTANGATYTPPATAAVLDADELLKAPGQDPITVERAGDDRVFNCFPVRIRNRAADYKESEYGNEETSHSAIYGQRRVSPVDGSWLTDAAQASRLSNLLAKRSIYSRNVYRFRLAARWAALEVMDYVSLTEPVTGIAGVLCRVESIRRLQDGSLELSAREAPEGSATAIDYTPQTEDGYNHPLPGLPSPGGVKTYYQADPPPEPLNVGDLWFETDQGNKPYRWNGTIWEVIRDETIADAQAAASEALTLAGSGTRVYHKFARPDSVTTGYDTDGRALVDGDLWFSMDTTTVCPLGTSCPGTLGDDGVQRSPATHRGIYWPHRWNTALGEWRNSESTALLIAQEIAAGAIVAGKIAAGQLKTSNYAEDGSGYATAGVKLDHTGTALKAAVGGVRFGATLFSDLWSWGYRRFGGSFSDSTSTGFTSLASMSYAPGSSDPTFYRGSVAAGGNSVSVKVTQAGNYLVHWRAMLSRSTVGLLTVEVYNRATSTSLWTVGTYASTASAYVYLGDQFHASLSANDDLELRVSCANGVTTTVTQPSLTVSRLPD